MDIEAALVHYKELLAEAVRTSDRSKEMRLNDTLGQLYFGKGEYLKAEEHYQRLADIANDVDDQIGEGLACYSLGTVSEAKVCYKQALEHYQRSLNLAMQVSDKQLEGMANYKIGNIYRKQHDYINAIKHHRLSLAIAKESSNIVGEGRSYCSLGEESYSLGDFIAALDYHEKHFAITKTTNNRREQALANRNIGCAFTSLGQYDKAIDNQSKSLAIAKEIGDVDGEKCTYMNLGVVFEALGKYQEAIDYLEKSLDMSKKAGDRKVEGKCYGNLANIYMKKGDFHAAFQYAKKDLEIAVGIADRHGEGSACGNLAIICSSSGKTSDAIEYSQRFLDISKEIHYRHGEMKACGNLASIYLSLGRFEEALNFGKIYLDIANEVHDRNAVAKAYNNLADVYLSKGEYIIARDFYMKALEDAISIKDKKLEGTLNGNIGMFYLKVGKYNIAKEYLLKYLKIAQQLGDNNAEGIAHQHLGDIQFSIGKENEAIQHYEKASEIAKTTGNRQQEAKAYGSLGNCFGILGKYTKAVTYHQKDLEISIELRDKDGEGKACANIGNALLFSNSYDQALQYYERSLRITKEIGDKQREAIASLTLGNSYYLLTLDYEKQGYKSKAVETQTKSEHYFLESIASNEQLFNSLKQEDQFKISIVDTYIQSYQLLTAMYLATGQPEKALITSERRRAKALEDILHSKYSLQSSKVSGDFHHFTNYTEVKKSLLSPSSCIVFYSKLVSVLGTGDYETSMATWLLGLKEDAYFQKRDMQGLRSLVNAHDYTGVEGKADTLDIIINKAYTTMTVRGAHTNEQCEDRAIDDNVESRCVFDEELNEDYLEILYDALISPVQEQLVYDEVIIIPDGALFKVPFAALRDPTTKQFMSATKRIRISPSLTMLKILQESSADSHSMTGALIVGDPDVTGGRMYKGKERFFHQLPNAKLEAEKIAEVLGVVPLTGTQATKQAIKDQLQQGVALIHFATHGSAERGEIILSPNKNVAGHIPEEEDYLLTMNEVQQIGLRAKLVVLSCCHSGRGEIRCEGVVGMSRAFFAAGALAVVASLWAVDDRATRIFMEKFYANLKLGKRASVSLQQAMKEVRNMEQYNQTMYWAPFFLMGEDVTIQI